MCNELNFRGWEIVSHACLWKLLRIKLKQCLSSKFAFYRFFLGQTMALSTANRGQIWRHKQIIHLRILWSTQQFHNLAGYEIKVAFAQWIWWLMMMNEWIRFKITSHFKGRSFHDWILFDRYANNTRINWFYILIGWPKWTIYSVRYAFSPLKFKRNIWAKHVCYYPA